MKLTTKTKYGLRALMDLGLQPDTPRSIAYLAQAQNISVPYLEAIFARLKKAGIVCSVRGLHGGYTLSRPQNEITLYEILDALEESVTLAGSDEQDDPIRIILNHILWSKIDENIHRYLSTLTLDQLSANTFDDLMYYI